MFYYFFKENEPIASTIPGGNTNGTAPVFNFIGDLLLYYLYWENKEIITYSGFLFLKIIK